MARTGDTIKECPVQVTIGNIILDGNLCIPQNARAIVIFAHGSGSSRLSPRNQYVARELRKAGLGTLLFDLLTKEEEETDAVTAKLRFNIRLLAERLVGATDWAIEAAGESQYKLGYFGASTGAAAALVAASKRPEAVSAIVSRGGRPDLAGDALPGVKAPTLLIVGGDDIAVIKMNQDALRNLMIEKKLEIVPGATHLFEEPGALEEVAHLARGWFVKHLASP
jgi:dienelactone hydrolase